ncbi:hypothetical protein Tco_1020144 [Tanacetum coccineum]|uniref:Uncharacterized protein n=1 Tax=Tanacetum coccineum TaxID=301880 RepID=A0ABQ5FZ96_9ASTR
MVKTGLVEAIDSLVPIDERLATFRGIGYRQKDEKRSQNGQNRARKRKELKSQKSKSKSQQESQPREAKSGKCNLRDQNCQILKL